ncbi:MAG: DUF1018 domain-containing protein [Rhizobiaceae bacterium]|nr:DUF1018 domain-containing protein [Rhizobiaceae bacterium]
MAHFEVVGGVHTNYRNFWKLPYKEALRAFVKAEMGIDDPEWLTYAQANPVIEALKKIERRLS